MRSVLSFPAPALSSNNGKNKMKCLYLTLCLFGFGQTKPTAQYDQQEDNALVCPKMER
jgi:hypothetical protein